MKSWLRIFFGTGLIALALNFIYEPLHLVTGGFAGIAIIIKEISSPWIEGGIPLWISNLALNFPLFLIAFFMKGKAFVGKTLATTVLLSLWLLVIPVMDLMEGDMLLASLFGGALMGTGVGVILLSRATTGGTDTLASLIHIKLRHYSIPSIVQVIDGLIVIFGLYMFGIQRALYAVIAIFVTTRLSNMILEGFRYAKAAFIISEKHEEVGRALMKDLHRGVTSLHATGLYSGEEKQMLYCVVTKKEIIALKDMVAAIDKNAFIMVNDAREVLGEGFVSIEESLDF